MYNNKTTNSPNQITKLQPSVSVVPSVKTDENPTPVITITPSPVSQYFTHKKIYATMFWVGEKATNENDYIPNESSAWDTQWLSHYGGIDNPYTREGYYPKGFIPKENPFYFALPYNEFTNNGRKANASAIPWFVQGSSEEFSFLKNRWIKIQYKQQVCYGQWEDVGPFEEDDVSYVFGTSQPKNSRAGIDLSPALRQCLKMAANDYVDWQFIDEETVPDGPWKKIITNSQVNWQ